MPRRFAMKMIFIFMIILIHATSLLAQSTARVKAAQLNIDGRDSNKEVKPLSIGDKVPDVNFHKVLNYKTKTAKLSEFQGKLVILDMWSVFCTSCIASFPKLEKLQEEFGDNMQILLVNPHSATYDSEEKIIGTLDKFKTRTGFYPSLPIPIHDSILNNYFPHQSVPHTIWIDGDRNVIAITGSQDVTAENIRLHLEGKILDIGIKDDWAFDNLKPLLVDGNGGDPNEFVFRSLFTKYKSGIGYNSGVRLDENKKVTGIYVLNKVLRQFVNEAFSNEIGNLNNNRVLIESDNPSKYKWELDTANAYCYDLSISPTELKLFDTQRFMQEDLKRFFNISIRIEKKKMVCLVITQTNKLKKSATKYQMKELVLEENSVLKYIRNYPVERVIDLLDRFEKPMINETGAKRHINIEFPVNADLSDINTVVNAFKDAGFKVREEERTINVAIISDKK